MTLPAFHRTIAGLLFIQHVGNSRVPLNVCKRALHFECEMVRRCCVDGCSSNSTLSSPYVTVYLLPSDPEDRERWIAALPNYVNIVKSTGVCRKHWPPDAPLKKVKKHYRPTNPPSVFPGCTPAMFIQQQPGPSRRVEERQLSLQQRNSMPDELDQFTAMDTIGEWSELMANLSTSQAVTANKLVIVNDANKATLYQIRADTIVISVSIDKKCSGECASSQHQGECP